MPPWRASSSSSAASPPARTAAMISATGAATDAPAGTERPHLRGHPGRVLNAHAAASTTASISAALTR